MAGRRPGIFLFLFLATLHRSNAQPVPAPDSGSVWKGWTIAAAFCYGKIIKHTPKFQPEIEDPSKAFELTLAKQLRGERSWHYVHHYPFLGVATMYNDVGNDEVLGKAWSVLPFVEVPVAGGKNLAENGSGFAASFRVGTGIAYITEHYDPEENPTNNVIGSGFNNITQFMLSGHYRTNEQWTFSLGTSLTHYSTGAVRLPNLGMNIPALRLGVRWQPKPYQREEYISHPLTPPPQKIFFQVMAGWGFQELYPAFGPMYHVYATEASAGKMIARWNLLSIGVHANYKEASYAFIRQQEIYHDNYFANSLAAAIFLKEDFIFGDIGIPFNIGYYFYQPSPIQISFYQKVGAYYAFSLDQNDYGKKLSAGVYITAGNFTADYVSVEAGFRF